jgi:molecular chaperone DnaK
MIKDAEQHANEDAKKKELVETRNMAEGMVTSTEKMLEENKDKATEEEITSISDASDKLKKLLENEDTPTNDLKVGIEDLSKASQSFAEKLYAEAQNEKTDPSSDESEDVVEGEVIEDE